MENFLVLLTDVWNRGFLGINLGAIISSLIVLLIAFLLRGFVISVIINALSRLAANTESTIDDEILDALKKTNWVNPNHSCFVCVHINTTY